MLDGEVLVREGAAVDGLAPCAVAGSKVAALERGRGGRAGAVERGGGAGKGGDLTVGEQGERSGGLPGS